MRSFLDPSGTFANDNCLHGMTLSHREIPLNDTLPPGATTHNSRDMQVKDVVRLVRPKHWLKGLLVFAALLFTRGYTDGAKVILSLEAFAAMSLVSSAVYVLNDLLDVDRDRQHPVKKNRPLASGAVSKPVALLLIAICGLGGLAIGYLLGPASIAVLIGYLVLQALYNLGLKHQPVADVFCISTGFVLRASLGAAAINVAVSGWLLFCTGALALLLGFGKRRHEFILQGEARESSRESLAHYTRPALDGMILTAAGSAAMSYGIYSIQSPTAQQHPALILSSLWVFYGVYRYLFLLLANDEGGEPENLMFRDPHLVVSVVCFVITVLAAMGGLNIPFIEGMGK